VTDLPVEEREALDAAMRAEIDAAFERGTSGGPKRVFEAGWIARGEYSKQREEKLREALTKIIAAHEDEDGFAYSDALEREVLSIARAALAENEDTIPGGLGDRRSGA
jgi:hypothetical protein